jgi:hypothetical protein
MPNNFKEIWIYSLIIVFVVAIVSLIFFGFTGLRVSLGIFLISLPFYFILNNFDLEQSEKIVFSILLGVTLFSSFVYLLGFVISFRISTAVIFIILILVAILLKRYKRLKK